MYQGFSVGYNSTRDFRPNQVEIMITPNNTLNEVMITTKFYVTIKNNGTYNIKYLLPFHLIKLPNNNTRIIYKNYSHGVIIGTSREYQNIPKSESAEVNDVIIFSFYSNDTFISGEKGKYLLVLPFSYPDYSSKEINLINDKFDIPFIISNLTKTISINLSNQFIITNSIPNYNNGPNYSNYTFNVKWEAPKLQTFSLYLDSPNEIESYNYTLFLGGLYVGIGIPLTIQGIIEWIKLIIESLDKNS